jgi:flagellar hook assembly protein FlgD
LAGNTNTTNTNVPTGEVTQETTFESSEVDATPNSLQCSPNPFSDDLNLRFNIAQNADNVVLKIFDIQGRLVANNEQGASLQGYYTMRWNLSELNSGVYHVCLEVDGKCVKTERVIMEK